MASNQKLCVLCRDLDLPGQIMDPSPDSWKKSLGPLHEIKKRSLGCTLCDLVTIEASRRWAEYVQYAQTATYQYTMNTFGTYPDRMGEFPGDGTDTCFISLSPEYATVLESESHAKRTCCRIEVFMSVGTMNLQWDFVLLSFLPCENPIPTVKTVWEGPNLHLSFPSGRLVDSKFDVRLVKHWLDTCLCTHKEGCANPGWVSGGHKQLQKLRLIDVHKRCLVDRSPHCEYLALSYVWGAPRETYFEYATSGNYEFLTAPGALSDDKIPSTIRDSMNLAAGLGIAYLWVDRYCIHQDSPQDKAEYIPKMDDIYALALFTICATNGRDAYAGLAGSEHRERVPQHTAVEIDHRISLLKIPTSAENSFQKSKWRERGWTLQEQFCSRRALIITDDNLTWICEMATWPENIVFEPGLTAFTVNKLSDLGYDLNVAGSGNRFQLSTFSALAGNFQRRELTNEGDAADALSGLIRRFSTNIGIQFYWGHPLDARFGESLTWDHFGRCRKIGRRGFCTVVLPNGKFYSVPLPSWSWLAWKGGNSFSYADKGIKGQPEFYRLDTKGKAQKLDLSPHSYDSKPKSTSKAPPAWVGTSSTIPNERLCRDLVFEDSGRLLFWTSHAKFRIKRELEGHWNVMENSIYSSLASRYAGKLRNKDLILPKSDKESLYSFIVTSYDGWMVDLLMVEWKDEDNHVASCVSTAKISDEDWMKEQPEWILCTLI